MLGPLVVVLATRALSAVDLEVQVRGRLGGATASRPETLSVPERMRIGDFYSSRTVTGAEALPPGFEILEEGLDVLLVEVAADIVHDRLMDIIR